jgi:ornithine decarboxylase
VGVTTVVRFAAVPELTPALEAFLDRNDIPTPFVVVDVDVVEDRYRELVRELPEATVFYAVKANPAAPLLERLVALGSCFDVASPAEIDACVAAGARPQQISYGNTIKKRADIHHAMWVGVRRFSVDCDAELRKVLDVAAQLGVDDVEIGVRLRHDCGGADWPLSRKFGCDPAEVERLIVQAHQAGAATGVSFHVGSQQRDLSAWDDTLRVVAGVLERVRQVGVRVQFLNVGGGFPAQYVDPTASTARYAAAVRDAVARHVPHDAPSLMIEPGRSLVADAGVLRSEVVLVSRRSDTDVDRWVYVDCGKFHGLAETMDEAIRYRLRTRHDGSPTGPVALAGPTCDSADVLYEKTTYHLPLALAEGDHVDVLSAGAYTTTYSSVGFNGFAPLADYYVSGR